MIKTSTKFKKELIENGEVRVKHPFKNKENFSIMEFVWIVKDYKKLKREVFYYQPISMDYKWSFHLVKAKGTLFIILFADMDNKNAYLSILNAHSTQSIKRKAKRIGPGVYVSEYCNNGIVHPESHCLTDDLLMVQCEWEINTKYLSTLILPYHRLENMFNVHELFDDLKHLNFNSLFTDFTIKVKKTMFRIHKVVLRTCTKFFEVYIDDGRNEFTINTTTPHIMRHVLLYLYSFKMVDQEVVEVLHVAHMMNIPCLESACIKFIKSITSQNNATKVYDLGKMYLSTELENEALRFMPNNELQSLRLEETAKPKPRSKLKIPEITSS